MAEGCSSSIVAPRYDASRMASVVLPTPIGPSTTMWRASVSGVRGVFSVGNDTALTLPQQSLVLRDGFTYAMRIEANNKVSQVKLQTGKRSGDAV